MSTKDQILEQKTPDLVAEDPNIRAEDPIIGEEAPQYWSRSPPKGMRVELSGKKASSRVGEG